MSRTPRIPDRSPSQRARRISLGTLLGLVGVLIAISALTPAGWADAVGGWASFMSDNIVLLGTGFISLCGGIALGVLVLGRRRDTTSIRVVDGGEYSKLFRERIESAQFAVVKVFGYTGETVLNDLLRFDDRYNDGLEVRLLHRNWLEEVAAESAHNSQPDAHPKRPWDKARAIRSTATAEWPHAMTRRIRYYDGPPSIKAVLLCAARDGPREAFVTFFEWIAWPEGGGSQFKASGMTTMYIAGATQEQRNILRYLESQFDLKWANSKSCADVLAEEQRVERLDARGER